MECTAVKQGFTRALYCIDRLNASDFRCAGRQTADSVSLLKFLLELKACGMAHFEPGPGEIWRKQDGHAAVVEGRRGVCLTIPLGTEFQFRSFGPEPLSAIVVIMPPWPGEGEAIIVTGPWKPTA